MCNDHGSLFTKPKLIAAKNMCGENPDDKSLNLLVDQDDSNICAINTHDKLVWCMKAVAVGSSACNHVAPANVFSLSIEPTEKSKAGRNYFGAGGDRLNNPGAQRVQSQDLTGQCLMLEFDIADKVANPLASVYKITQKGNSVTFEKDGGYVLHKAT